MGCMRLCIEKCERWNAAGREWMRMDGWGRCYMAIKGSVYSLAGDESPGSERVILRHRVSVFRFGNGVAERDAQAPGVRLQYL